MSDKCGSCDCADKSQCDKKGSSYGLVIQTEKSNVEATIMGAEQNENCKCGASCACVNCTCSH